MTKASYTASIERDDAGEPQRIAYTLSVDPDATPVYPQVDVQHGRDTIESLVNDLLTHLRRVTLLHDPAFVRCFLTADLDGDLERYRKRLAAVLRGA